MNKKQKKELKRIIIAAVIFFALLVFEHTAAPGLAARIAENASGTEAAAALIERWGMFALYLIPYCIVGLPVLRKAVLGIGHGQFLDESFLMSLATVGAFAVAENAEAVAVMLFYQIGEFFQSYAVGKSRGQIKELMEIAPSYANLIGEDGTDEKVDPDDVEPGSLLLVRPGEKIPIDGVVITGESMLNTAALTGEPVPRTVRPGDAVISGCINGDGLLTIRTEKAYEDSTVSRILEMVENASARKSRTENFITRFAKYYTPVVVGCALALALIPPLFTGSWGTWILRACTFLVISCPCALVISVPLSFFGGIGAASKKGILVKGSNFLEQMASVTTIVTDKTGTLTLGVFEVQKIIPAEGVSEREVLALAAAAESTSTHPIAKSIRDAWHRYNKPKAQVSGAEDSISAAQSSGAADSIPTVTAAENHSGEGIAALTDAGLVLAGNTKLMERCGVRLPEEEETGENGVPRDEGYTVVYVAADGIFKGRLLIADEVKPEAAEAVRRMKAAGVRELVMLTGDHAGAAGAVAAELGIDRTVTELLPEDKVRTVEELLAKQEKGTHLAFVGDGINDAPVLTRADVGVAMGALGADAAIEAADLVIMDDDLRKIPEAIRIARKTVGIAKQNIVFALAVKIAILILGALGLAGMWAAVFADVGVAVIAILNAMRTLRS